MRNSKTWVRTDPRIQMRHLLYLDRPVYRLCVVRSESHTQNSLPVLFVSPSPAYGLMSRPAPVAIVKPSTIGARVRHVKYRASLFPPSYVSPPLSRHSTDRLPPCGLVLQNQQIDQTTSLILATNPHSSYKSDFFWMRTFASANVSPLWWTKEDSPKA